MALLVSLGLLPRPVPGGSLLTGPDTKLSAQGTAITAGVGEPLAWPDFTCLGST